VKLLMFEFCVYAIVAGLRRPSCSQLLVTLNKKVNISSLFCVEVFCAVFFTRLMIYYTVWIVHINQHLY